MNTRTTAGILASLSICAAALIAADASAAYSGTIVRSVCPAGSMIADEGSAGDWSYGTGSGCWVTADSAGSWRYAKFSIPVERATSTTTITTTVEANGDLSSHIVCAQALVFTSAGALSSSSSSDCTTGGSSSDQQLVPGNLTLPVDGLHLISVAGINLGIVKAAAVEWTALAL